MDSKVVTLPHLKYLSLLNRQNFYLTSKTVADLIAECLSERVSCVLAEERHFRPEFFRLQSLEAGEILQKLRSYDIRVAALIPPDREYPKRFREMLAEEKRAGYFAIFADQQSAVDWFLSLA